MSAIVTVVAAVRGIKGAKQAPPALSASKETHRMLKIMLKPKRWPQQDMKVKHQQVQQQQERMQTLQHREVQQQLKEQNVRSTT
mmetsp:Transcript_32451/g.75600  ORF Transcript_32451/g.75600 Transcript_32451/m.75600 type:complete len:84 (-) Transcript_32451:271-522(-)